MSDFIKELQTEIKELHADVRELHVETIELINKQIAEKERAILFLQHKDRWTSDDNTWYDKTRHEIKKLLEARHKLEKIK